MTLTIDVNSWVTRAQADTYFADRHSAIAESWDEVEDDEKDNALVMARLHLDRMFVWKGDIAVSTQPMGWPRKNVFDDEGREVDDETVPQAIKDAQCELAYQWAAADQMTPPPTLFTADEEGLSSSRGLKRRKLGQLEEEYFPFGETGSRFTRGGGFSPSQKVYELVDMLVAPYIWSRKFPKGISRDLVSA